MINRTMKPFKKLVATTGKYTNRDGQEKNNYVNVGTLFQAQDDKGNTRLVIKLDSVPTSTTWTGFINCYDIEERKQEPQVETLTSAEIEPPF